MRSLRSRGGDEGKEEGESTKDERSLRNREKCTWGEDEQREKAEKQANRGGLMKRKLSVGMCTCRHASTHTHTQLLKFFQHVLLHHENRSIIVKK